MKPSYWATIDERDAPDPKFRQLLVTISTRAPRRRQSMHGLNLTGENASYYLWAGWMVPRLWQWVCLCQFRIDHAIDTGNESCVTFTYVFNQTNIANCIDLPVIFALCKFAFNLKIVLLNLLTLCQNCICPRKSKWVTAAFNEGKHRNSYIVYHCSWSTNHQCSLYWTKTVFFTLSYRSYHRVANHLRQNCIWCNTWLTMWVINLGIRCPISFVTPKSN